MFVRPKIERDPNIQQLEQSVFSKLQTIAKEYEPSASQQEDVNAIRFVSFEEALKELAALNNK